MYGFVFHYTDQPLFPATPAYTLLKVINSDEKRWEAVYKNIDGDEFIAKYGHKCPTGVRGRNSDNKLYIEKMGTSFDRPLSEGIVKTFNWIKEQI